jgi:hypothetical protein
MKIISTIVTVLLATSYFALSDPPTVGETDKDVIAVVLGKKITVAEKNKLRGIILGTLLERFAVENKIEPTQEELDAFVLKNEELEKQHHVKWEADRKGLTEELKSASLPDEERKEKAARLVAIESILHREQEVKNPTPEMEEQIRLGARELAGRFVQSWKINKALYEKYGGRVIFQQAGAEPLDAYRDFLKEQERKGRFQILDENDEDGFWQYFTNEAMHRFYNDEEGAKFMNTPWWMSDKTQQE